MSSDDMVKHTNEDIRWQVKRVSLGKITVKQASRTYRITDRRVQQLPKNYRDTCEFPKSDPIRRSKKHLNNEQTIITRKILEEALLGVGLLFYELKGRNTRFRTTRPISTPKKLIENFKEVQNRTQSVRAFIYLSALRDLGGKQIKLI